MNDKRKKIIFIYEGVKAEENLFFLNLTIIIIARLMKNIGL